MTNKERMDLLLALDAPLAFVPRPFALLARELGIGEQEVVRRLRTETAKGVIRRVGVQLAHRSAGLKANALIAWEIPPRKRKACGLLFASCPEVSHCYARRIYPQWPFSLYTMVHASSRGALQRVIKKMSYQSGITSYVVLTTSREWKKTRLALADILNKKAF